MNRWDQRDENEVRTRVALSSPASVSPTRIDNSSVANAKSCGARRTRLVMVDTTERMHTFARGMIARKETAGELSVIWDRTMITHRRIRVRIPQVWRSAMPTGIRQRVILTSQFVLMRYSGCKETLTETGMANKRTLNPSSPCQDSKYAQKQIGYRDAQVPNKIFLISCTKPGGSPTLCSVTNKTEMLVLALCSLVTGGASGFWVLAVFAMLIVVRPVFLLR